MISRACRNPECTKCIFENSVDPEKLASEKPAYQDPHCFFFLSRQRGCFLVVNAISASDFHSVQFRY